MKRKASSDGNPIVKKPCPLSPTMPYDRIKMDAAARDTGYRKQVATKSTTNRADASIKVYYTELLFCASSEYEP
jgi:hypothetical protein